MKRFLMLIVIAMSMLGSPGHGTIGSSDPPPPLDIVTLKDGSVVYGEVIELVDGELKLKTSFGVKDVVTIKWESVAKLSINHPIPFHLKEGTVLMGTAQEGTPGTLLLKIESNGRCIDGPNGLSEAINPLIQPPVVYLGNLNAGLSQASGNSHVRNASVLGDLTGRGESLRLMILGRYFYGDDNGQLTRPEQSSDGQAGFFSSKRFYWFAAAYFGQDMFQDFQSSPIDFLRVPATSHRKGDYASPYLKI